jgi:hypothetical protein
MADTTKKRSRQARRVERQRKRALAKPARRSRPEPTGRPPLPGPDDLDGGAGVREPRRPFPTAPGGVFMLDEPGADYLESQYLELVR